MKLAYRPLALAALLGFLCIGYAAQIRSAGRYNHARALRRGCIGWGGNTMGMDCPTSSSSPIHKPTSTKTSPTLPYPTHAAPADYPTGTHDAAPIWYPEDGAGIEIYKMVTPGKPQPYTSNGTCVNLLDYKSRKTAYVVDAFRLAPGIACQFYYLPDCQQPIPSEGHGKTKNEGFWNVSMIWHPPIFSSFQCWPKACEQPVPPINYAVDATATFTCAHGPTMTPVGFTPGKYKIVVSSGLTATLPSSTTRIPSSTHMDSSSFTTTTTTTMYTVYSAVQSTVTARHMFQQRCHTRHLARSNQHVRTPERQTVDVLPVFSRRCL